MDFYSSTSRKATSGSLASANRYLRRCRSSSGVSKNRIRLRRHQSTASEQPVGTSQPRSDLPDLTERDQVRYPDLEDQNPSSPIQDRDASFSSHENTPGNPSPGISSRCQSTTKNVHTYPHSRLRTSRQSLSLVFTFALLSCLSLPLPVSLGYSSSFFSRKFPTVYEIWENEVTLGKDRDFVVQWTPEEDRIRFRITAETRGYIGFGIHDKPFMDGADIVVGWVHSGKAYLQDRHGIGNEEPSVDSRQDWDLVGGLENDTHTVLIMSRLFNTCDQDDHEITNSTVRLLWAYHPDDPVDPESPRPRLHYHGGVRRGSTTLFLLQRSRGTEPRVLQINHPRKRGGTAAGHEKFEPPPTRWSLIGPVATLPASEDSIHWCRLFKRPRINKKHHIVKYEPVLSRGNRPFIHHMMVYECIRLSSQDEALLESLSETNGSFCNLSMSAFLSACNHVVVAWYKGSEGVWLPPEAGYPITPDGPLFYMLETHYEPPKDHPMEDSSGVSLSITPNLRANDAGVLSVGLEPNWKHLIPPRQPRVLSEGHCIGRCSEKAFPPQGLNVFGVIFHTHLLGSSMRLRHIRGETEFEPIAQDSNYDFNYQEYRSLRNTRTVLPGDHMVTECVYNSEERSSITLGGFKTRDEICLSFLFYWPKVDLSFCHSKPSLATVLQSLGIEELSEDSNPITIRRPSELAGKSLKWRLQNYDWENQFEHFQDAFHRGTFNPMCLSRGSSLTPDLDNHDYSSPIVSKEWQKSQVCEKEKRKSGKQRKKKHRGRGSDLTLNGDVENDNGGLTLEDDVMIDDQTSFKPIETVDVDPIRSFDFMPVIGGNENFGTPDYNHDYKQDEFDTRFTQDFPHSHHDFPHGHHRDFDRIHDGYDGNRDSESPVDELIEEFEEMERDLENEIHRKHDAFHEKSHKSNGATGSKVSLPLYAYTLFAALMLTYGRLMISSVLVIFGEVVAVGEYCCWRMFTKKCSCDGVKMSRGSKFETLLKAFIYFSSVCLFIFLAVSAPG